MEIIIDKILAVFLDVGGRERFPNRSCKKLPEILDFEAVWVVDLHFVDEGKYV